MEYSVSITKGKGNTKHNTRTQADFPPNADRERTPSNVVLKQSDIRKVYEDTFNVALKEYNEKQVKSGHRARQIKNYYSHVAQDKRTNTFYELVIQVGNVHERPPIEVTNEIYRQFLDRFETRCPQMLVTMAVIHNDEATPHMHMDYIPVVYGSEKGLKVHVNNTKCIKQMGFDGWNAWHDSLYEDMESIMKGLGLERKVVNSNHKHLSVDQYKAAAELYNREREKMPEIYQPIQRKKALFSSDKVKVPAAELDALENQGAYLTMRARMLTEEETSFKDEKKRAQKRISERDEISRQELKQSSYWHEKASQQDIEIQKLKIENTTLSEENKQIGSENARLRAELKESNTRIETLDKELKSARYSLHNIKSVLLSAIHALNWLLEYILKPEIFRNVLVAIRQILVHQMERFEDVSRDDLEQAYTDKLIEVEIVGIGAFVEDYGREEAERRYNAANAADTSCRGQTKEKTTPAYDYDDIEKDGYF